jgi:TPR repeat protein
MENRGDIMNWKFYILLSALTISTQALAAPQTQAQSQVQKTNVQNSPQHEVVSSIQANKTACASHYQREQYKRALETCQAAAQLADAESQYILGQIFLNGHGVNPDYVSALTWFEKAATQKPHNKSIKTPSIPGDDIYLQAMRYNTWDKQPTGCTHFSSRPNNKVKYA